jgi:hypothetical protein
MGASSRQGVLGNLLERPQSSLPSNLPTALADLAQTAHRTQMVYLKVCPSDFELLSNLAKQAGCRKGTVAHRIFAVGLKQVLAESSQQKG